MLMWGRFLLALSVSVAMLGVFEVGFRVAGFRPLYEIYSKPSIFWRYDAALGWTHEPGAQGIYRGPRPWPIEFENQVEINAQGLRGPEVGPPSAQRYRILFLGDSVVAGFEVAEHETVVARVEARLDAVFDFDVEAINGGVRGYGTDQSYLYYQRVGRHLEPDLVIFHHSYNDPRNNMTLHKSRRPFGKGAFALDRDGSLRLQGVPVPDYPLCAQVAMNADYRIETLDTFTSHSMCMLETTLSDRSALFTWVARVLQQRPGLLRWLYGLGSKAREVTDPRGGWLLPAQAHAAPRPDAAIRLPRALVIALHDEAVASGAEFALWISRGQLARLGRREIEASGVEVIHTEQTIRGPLAAPIIFANDSHWNARGHRIIADLLSEQLIERIRGQRAGPANAP